MEPAMLTDKIPEGLRKLWSRKLAAGATVVWQLMEAGQYEVAGWVTVGYMLSVGLAEAAERLNIPWRPKALAQGVELAETAG
jgi:hypothetical protein